MWEFAKEFEEFLAQDYGRNVMRSGYKTEYLHISSKSTPYEQCSYQLITQNATLHSTIYTPEIGLQYTLLNCIIDHGTGGRYSTLPC
jgi:hypothetical protein